MKKYLITGAMALLAGFYLTSCTHDDVGNQGVYEEKTQTFSKVFHDLYGDIAPNHDWGFKSLNSIAIANSRAAAGTRGHNANANEWADPEKAYGGWDVPDALDDEQKLRVKLYFQTHKNLGYEDPKYQNFFVQQVYKGSYNTRNTDDDDYSDERYARASNPNDFVGSDNMNQLSAGPNGADHINNFNHGTYSDINIGTPFSVDVLNNGQKVGGESHPDQIMLMVNSRTDCFSYHNSGCNRWVNNKMALVSAKDIDDWAEKEAGGVGKTVSSNKWKRSFMGFDFEMFTQEQVTLDKTVKYSHGPESASYAKVNGTIVKVNSNDDLLYNDKPIHYLSTNTSEYCGVITTISDSELMEEYRVNGQYMGKALNYDKIKQMLDDEWLPVNDKNLREWVKVTEADGYYSDWIVTLTQAVKVGSTEEIDGPDDPEDHPGETVTETSTGDEHKLLAIGRVFVEDLYKATREDLDFNDAVFDAAIWQHTTNGTITVNTDGTKPTFTPIEGKSVVTREVEIYLIAAGGTIPLMIANGCNAIGGDDKHEVHEIFGVSGVTMVNTRGQYSTAFGSYQNGVSPKYKKYDMTSILTGKAEGEITLNDIPVDVIWATDQFSVSASLNNAHIVEYEKDEDGKYIVDVVDGKNVPRVKQTGVATAPHMIQVDLGTDWATERRNIADCYPAFKTYVNDGVTEFWGTTTEESSFNLYEQNVTTFNKENYGDGKTALTPDYAYYTNVQKVVSANSLVTDTYLQENAGVTVADKAYFDNVAPGYKLRIYGKIQTPGYGSASDAHLRICTPWHQQDYLPFVGVNSANNVVNRLSNGCIELEFTEETINQIKNGNGLHLIGKFFYIDSVTISAN